MTNRFLLKQFAENGDKGVFGSYQAGNKTVSSDPATLQSLTAWTNGWADAISNGSHLPAMEEFQAVQYLICKAVKELYSEGIPVWMAGETYYKGAICSYIDSDGNVALYKNITGNNGVQQPALDIVNWATFSAGGGGANDTIPLFTHKYFEFKPNHISWVPANTVQAGSVYTSAYNTLVGCLTSNPYEIKVIDEADEQVGVDYSEYWIVNQTNETFRTPITVSEKALNGVVKGNGMALGLTNGTDLYGAVKSGTGDSLSFLTGAYGKPLGGNVNTGTSASSGNAIGITTDPTKSGIIAQEATSYLYFKVGNAVQNLELINVGRIEENKADINASNFNQTGKSYLAGIGMPSHRYDELTLLASGSTYTAPANGWVQLVKVSGIADAYIAIKTGELVIVQHVPGTQNSCSGFAPVKRGEPFSVSYDATGTTARFRFYYAEGEENV